MPFLPLRKLLALTVLFFLMVWIIHFLIEWLVPIPPSVEEVSLTPHHIPHMQDSPPWDHRPLGEVHAV